MNFLHPGEQDVLEYTPDGNKFVFSYFPKLSAVGFPIVQNLEVTLRKGIEAGLRCPIESGGRALVEYENKVFAAYIFVVHGGRLPMTAGEGEKDGQTFCVLADLSGKVVFTIQGPFVGAYSPAIDFLVDSYNLKNYGKKEAEVKQTILPVDEEKLTHEFTCEIIAPGGKKYVHRGAVSDLRKKGLLGGKGSYFKEATLWPIDGRTFAIATDHDNFIHGLELTKEGGLRIAKSERYYTVLSSISSHLKTAQQL